MEESSQERYVRLLPHKSVSLVFVAMRAPTPLVSSRTYPTFRRAREVPYPDYCDYFAAQILSRPCTQNLSHVRQDEITALYSQFG